MASQLNLLDRLIGYFAPRTLAKRASARHAAVLVEQHLDLTVRNYDGASRKKRLSGWKSTSTDYDSTLGTSVVTLRNRSHDMIRNNAYARRAVSVITSNTIGTGIVASLKTKSGVENPEALAKVEAAWNLWAETPAIDFERRLDFYGLQNLVMRSVVSSGWVFFRKRFREPTLANPLGLSIQILEADYLDLSKSTTKIAKADNGNEIIHGIEYDDAGIVQAYWLFPEHPGNANRAVNFQSYRVSAEDVKMVMKIERPGQYLAAPWLSPVIVKIKDFEEYQDATLLRQKIAACYSVFVIDANPSGVTAFAQGNDQGSIPDKVQPGMIEKLGMGQDVRFASPPGADGSGDFNRETLRAISSGLDIPYEALTTDLSNVNFSSGRMGWLEFHRNIEQWRWNMIIPQFCDVVWNWFVDAAKTAKPTEAQGFYPQWTPPAREMIDPNAESNSTITQVRGGFMTLSEAIRQRGLDPKKVLTERKEELKMMDDMGLVFDTDPRKIMKAGIAQTPDALATFTGESVPGDSPT